MKNVSELYTLKERPIKVLQFGEGNFLRAFVDYAIVPRCFIWFL